MTFKLLDLSLFLSLTHTHRFTNGELRFITWWYPSYCSWCSQHTCTNFRLPKADISIAYKTCNPDTSHWWSNLYTDVTDLVFNSKAGTVWIDMQIKVNNKKKAFATLAHPAERVKLTGCYALWRFCDCQSNMINFENYTSEHSNTCVLKCIPFPSKNLFLSHFKQNKHSEG